MWQDAVKGNDFVMGATVCVRKETPGLGLQTSPPKVGFRPSSSLGVPCLRFGFTGLGLLVVLVFACAGWALDFRWPVPSRAGLGIHPVTHPSGQS